MRKATWILACCALVVAGLPSRGSAAQEIPGEEKTPGRRLAVTFTETREGSGPATSRSCTLALHADVGQAHLFVGNQAAILIRRQDTPTTSFKNVGVTAGVGATSLSDGRYRLEVSFEQSTELVATTDARVSGSNPIMQVVRGESRITLRPGEAAPLARAVDPVSGEVVRIDVRLAEVPEKETTPSSRASSAPLQARLVVVRRQGQTKTARRPYSIVLPPADGASEEGSADVFSGSMLPVQVMANNQITVALKDVGAGMRIQARRVEDGRFRLDVEFSDGVLAPGRDGPKIHTFESQSTLFVRVGETVSIAAGVDPVTGETVEAEVTLEEAR